MEAKQADALRELVVVRGDRAAVAEREQVLGREEAEGRGDAGRGDASRAEGLGRVLEQRDAEAFRSSSAAGRPKRWTGMIALVRGVIRLATSSGSMLRLVDSISAKTGRAPRRMIASAVA